MVSFDARFVQKIMNGIMNYSELIQNISLKVFSFNSRYNIFPFAILQSNKNYNTSSPVSRNQQYLTVLII